MTATQIMDRLANVLLDASIKSAAVLLVAAVIVWWLRKKSAALRHATWVLALAMAVLMPLLSLALPAWQVNILPQRQATAAAVQVESHEIAPASPATFPHPAQPGALPATSALRSTVMEIHPSRSIATNAPRTIDLPEQAEIADAPLRTATTFVAHGARPIRGATWIVIIWLAGAALLAAGWVIGVASLWLSVRRSKEVTSGPLHARLRELASQTGINRNVRLLISEDSRMPMTWGSIRPRILLPASASEWPASRFSAVLLHELSHVARCDCATQLLAEVARMIYWFNPLAWWAHSRLRAEQERACDDVVLAQGTVPTAYAEDLVTFAKSLRCGALGGAPAVAMARRSHLRSRVSAIIDHQTNRRRPSRRLMVGIATIAAAVLFPLSSLHLGQSSRSAKAAPIAKADAQNPATRPVGASTQPSKTLDLLVTDAGTHQPLSQVKVELTGENWSGQTGTDGHILVPIPPDHESAFFLRVEAKHYVREYYQWTKGPNSGVDPLPASYTMHLLRGTTARGRVVDDVGKGIAGAHVVFSATKKLPSIHERLDARIDSLITANDGTWSYDDAPAEPDQITIGVWDYRYESHQFYPINRVTPISSIFDGSHTDVLHPGVPISGTVDGPDGKPMEKASVLFGGELASNRMPPQITGKDGKFAFAAKAGEIVVLTVKASGCAPDLQQFLASKQKQEVNFKLQPALKLLGKVVDSNGKPIAHAWLFADTWRGNRSLETQLRTDDNGRFSWNEAPADPVYFDVTATGYLRQQNQPLSASGQEVAVTLQRALHIYGTVIDAQTNQPIDTFAVIPGQLLAKNMPMNWDRRGLTPSHRQGKFEYEANWARDGYAVRIEAPGYLPAESRVFKAEEGAVSAAFRLTKAKDTSLTILRSDRKPAVGDTVLLVAAGQTAQISNERQTQMRANTQLETDAGGRVAIPPQISHYTLVIFGDDGFAQLDDAQLAGQSQITLKPWARIEGKVFIGKNPVPNQQMGVRVSEELSNPRADSSHARILHNISAMSDVNGNFLFDRVPPGSITVSRTVVRPMSSAVMILSSVDSQELDAVAGQTLHVTIGGGGRTVAGRAEIPEKIAALHDWTWDPMSYATTKIDLKVRMPSEIIKGSLEKRLEWMKTDAGKAYLKASQEVSLKRHMYPAEFQQDGSFHINGVAPGTYSFSVAIHRPNGSSTCGPGDILASGSTEFTVPQSPAPSDTPIEIPPIQLELAHMIEVGQAAPDFSVKTLDGKVVKLSNLRGKYVLIDFWASWCAPCVAEMPNVKSAVSAYANDQRLVVLSLNLDQTEANAQTFLKKNGSVGTEAFLPGMWDNPTVQAFGVRSIPSIWLIGPDGKVIAKGLRGEQIKTALSSALQ